jgi:hypothetical protein
MSSKLKMSKVVSREKKLELIEILKNRGYLKYLDQPIDFGDEDKFIKGSKKIPFAWLLNAYCLNVKKDSGVQLKRALRLLPLEDLGLKNCLEIKDTNDGKVDIFFTDRFIEYEGLDLQEKRADKYAISKSELYEVIKAIYPDYCPLEGCLAPIRAAHRNWYIVILRLACSNDGKVANKIDISMFTRIIQNVRQCKPLRKERVDCGRLVKMVKAKSDTDDEEEEEEEEGEEVEPVATKADIALQIQKLSAQLAQM